MAVNGDWRENYRLERDRMLTVAIDLLEGDERFVAAWLSGSFGRGEDDALSDVDLTVVVAEPFADRLCHRPHQVGAGTTSERLAILSAVRKPAIVRENHYHAPSGGSFTGCVYTNGVIFDWIFVPAPTAVRPVETKLLFDSADIPVGQPPSALSDSERLHRLSEQFTFFWMMVVPTTKVLLRGDLVIFHHMLDTLYRATDEVERLLDQRPVRYVRWSRAPFLTTAAERQDAMVEGTAPAIVEAGATVPETAWDTVAPWANALRLRNAPASSCCEDAP